MKQSTLNEWMPVIGLEIHCELNTQSKLFSRARNRFGDEPNENISEVCTAMPGALPYVNEVAVEKAVLFGCAIDAHVATWSRFDRKSYFYPDNPRNFQITQYEHPLIRGGSVTTMINDEERIFRITSAHLEDDSGTLKHFSKFAGVDYNRAGVPLIEIVSEPCMHSAEEASAYAQAIKAILEYIDISDCNMDEGSLRFDVNVSVKKKSEQRLRNKIEIKNMNSFSNLQLAIEHEIGRQITLYEQNPHVDPYVLVPQSTYRWDPERKKTVLMRKKERPDDYRYFPEPDLLPLVITQEYIEEIRKTLPELPMEKEKRYTATLGIPVHAAFVLVSNKKLSEYFEEALAFCPHAKSLANWITIEFIGRFKDTGTSLLESGILPEHIAELVSLIDAGTITGKIAKSLADDMIASPGTSPKSIIEKTEHYRPVDDVDHLQSLVDAVVASNMQSVHDFIKGKDRAFGFLVGQIMQQTKGAATPKIVTELLKKKIEEIQSTL